MKGKSFLAMLMLWAPAVLAEELSLRQVLELVRQGPAVQAAQAAASASEARVDEVRALRRPQVELEAQARGLRKDPGFVVPRGAFGNPVPLPLVTGEREVESGRLVVSQLLWDWQRTGLAVAASRAQARASEGEAVVVRQQVERAALEAVAQAWGAQGQLDAALEARKAAAETLRVVEAMVEQGLLAKSDELAAAFVVQQREAEVARARAALSAALAVLAELTGRSVDGVQVAPADLEAAAGLDTASPVRRRELQILAEQKDALESAAAAHRRESWPVLVAAGGVDHVRDSYILHQSNSFAALVVKASLFDGGEARARAKALALQAQAVEGKEAATKRAIERELAVAVAKERAAREALAAAERAVAAAAEEVRLESLRHGQGLATTRDLLQAQEHLAAGRAALAQSQAALLSALADKVAAVGEDFLTIFGGER